MKWSFVHGLVLPLKMVDNSIRSRERIPGGFSPYSTVSGRVPDPLSPRTCRCFHLHQAALCHFTGRLLTVFTLTWSSMALAAKDNTGLPCTGYLDHPFLKNDAK